MHRGFRSGAVLVALVMALTVIPVSAATAGEAGRNCKTYYAENNPASGWGFTVCVKIEHSPEIRSWRTNASISTLTPGVHDLNVVAILWSDGREVPVREGNSGDGPVVSVQSGWYRCSTSHYFRGFAEARVSWPNYRLSGFTRTHTYPLAIYGNC